MTATCDNRKVPRLSTKQINKQISALFNEHRQSAGQLRDRKRLGDYPLVTWLGMVSVRVNESRIEKLTKPKPGWGWWSGRGPSQIGECRRFSLRVAEKYGLTYVQQEWLARRMHFQWFGSRSRHECDEVPFGIALKPLYLNRIGSHRTKFSMVEFSNDLWDSRQLDSYFIPPLRAILDPRMTNLILMLQMEEFIFNTPRSRVRSAGDRHAVVNEV